MGDLINVLTMKWGTLYGADDVNCLYRQVSRHLSRPHRFVCFTDDASGLEDGIHALPLPDLDLPNADTRWRKLSMFRDDLFGLSGTALFLDLDLVVTGSLDPFFAQAGTFIAIRDDDLFRPKPLRKLRPQRDRFLHMVGNTSVFRYEIGAHADILTAYNAAPAEIARQYEHEQQFVSDFLNKQGKLSYWPRGLCVSFKNDCVGRGIATYLQAPACPSGASIVIFAGSPKLDEVLSGRANRWYRHIGNIDWLHSARSKNE